MIQGSGNYLVDSAEQLERIVIRKHKEELVECDECGCSMTKHDHQINAGICIDCIYEI